MPVDGGRKAEERLQQALDMGGGEKVAAAHHMGDALGGVIDDYRQMIGDAQVLAGEDDVAGRGRIGADAAALALRSGAFLLEEKRPLQPGDGGAQVETPGVGFAGGEAILLLRRGVRSGGEGRLGPVRGGADGGGDLGPGAEAAVEEAAAAQVFQGGAVVGQMVALAARRPVPDDPQPGKVLEEGGLELRTAAAGVDILDAKQEAAAFALRGLEGGEGRIGVAQMQKPRRRGGEAGDEGGVQAGRFRQR